MVSGTLMRDTATTLHQGARSLRVPLAQPFMKSTIVAKSRAAFITISAIALFDSSVPGFAEDKNSFTTKRNSFSFVGTEDAWGPSANTSDRLTTTSQSALLSNNNIALSAPAEEVAPVLLTYTVTGGSDQGSEVSQNSQVATLILTAKLEHVLDVWSVDEEFVDSAKKAVKDAIMLTNRLQLSGSPSISLSDDGILTMHWKRPLGGIALIFMGDGDVDYAISAENRTYTDHVTPFRIDDDIPMDLETALHQEV